MAITVQMIVDKEFKVKVKGYDQVEVDDFLDAICDEMIAMQDEINSLQSKLRAQPAAIPGAFGSVPTPAAKKEPEPAHAAPAVRDTSETARKLLDSAQQVYDQMVADARKEADEIVSGARARAESAVGDLENEKDRLKGEIETLKAAARDYRSRFLRLIEDQTHVINAEDELFKED